MALMNHQHVQGSEQKHTVREDGLSQCCPSGIMSWSIGCNLMHDSWFTSHFRDSTEFISIQSDDTAIDILCVRKVLQKVRLILPSRLLKESIFFFPAIPGHMWGLHSPTRD